MLPILFTRLHAVSGPDMGYHNLDDPVQGVVQAPGFVCMKTGRPLYNGVVVRDGRDSLALWAPLGREGEGLPDNTTWEDEINRNLGLFSLTDKTIFQALPKNQRAYFRSLNFYRRMLPEDQPGGRTIGHLSRRRCPDHHATQHGRPAVVRRQRLPRTLVCLPDLCRAGCARQPRRAARPRPAHRPKIPGSLARQRTSCPRRGICPRENRTVQ
jgi:hypothetical protein